VKLVRALAESVVLAVVFLLGGGIVAGFAALFALLAVINAVIVAIVFLRFDVPAPDPLNFRQYLAYGIPMVPKELSSKLLTHTDKYLLLYFFEPMAVAIYVVAQSICKPIVRLTAVFNPTLYPTISREWDDGHFGAITDIYRSIFRYYAILGIPAMVGIVVLAEPLISLLSTSEIARKGAHLVPVFIFGYFLRGYNTSLEYVLTSAERTDIIGMSVVVSALFNLVVNVALIPLFGIAGAAVATVMSYVLLFSITVYFAAAAITLTVPWKTIGRSSVAAATMGAVLLVVDPGSGVIPKLLLTPILGVVVYFGVLSVIGEFSKAELFSAKAVIENLI